MEAQIQGQTFQGMIYGQVRQLGRLKMKEKKVFINNCKKAPFVCPKCRKKKMLNVSGYRNILEEVRITHRCSCGNSYTLLLERRKFHRKRVSLSGAYVRKESRKTMIVKDLSRGGLKFEVKAEKDIKIGDKLFVEFCLDDSHQTLIQKEVIVRRIKGSHIGAEFHSPAVETLVDRAYDRAIAYCMLLSEM